MESIKKFLEPYLGKLFEELLEQKDRWILWSPVFVAIGVGFYFSLNFEPNQWVGITFTIIVSFIILSLYMKRSMVMWVPVFLVVVGFTAAQTRTMYLDAPVLEKKTYPLEITAQVAHIEALPADNYRVMLEDISYKAKYSLPQKPMPERIRVKLKKNSKVPHAGDVIKFRAMLLPISAPVMPGAFDFQRYAFFKDFGATGFAISDVEIITEREEGFLFPALRRYLRDNIKENIEDSDVAAITIALLDGEDKDISEKTNVTVRRAGIAHLMAISGLQVALVTGFFFFLLRGVMASIPYIALRYPIKKIAAFIAMFGAIFYMGLIGDSVSAERSVIMMCVVMIAIILDRDPFTLRLAAFASTAMLLLQPEILFGASFQLSFSAVVALIAFYEATRNWWSDLYTKDEWYSKIFTYLLASMATTIVATIAVAPFSLFHFLRASMFPGIVANLVAVPLSSFITIPFAILGSLLMPLGLEYYPLQVSKWSVEIILNVAKTVADWPYGMLSLDYWPVWILVVISLGASWICIWRGRIRLLGIIPIVFVTILIPFTPRADILAEGNGRVFAVRDDRGFLWFSEKRKEKFVRNSWEEMEGNEGIGFWHAKGVPIKCDPFACLYVQKGKMASFVENYLAVEEDCAIVDIVVSELYIKREICPQPDVLIHKGNLRKNGSHAVYISDYTDEIIVKSVRDYRGQRPWTRY